MLICSFPSKMLGWATPSPPPPLSNFYDWRAMYRSVQLPTYEVIWGDIIRHMYMYMDI